MISDGVILQQSHMLVVDADVNLVLIAGYACTLGVFCDFHQNNRAWHTLCIFYIGVCQAGKEMLLDCIEPSGDA